MIIAAIDALPDDLDPEIVTDAQARLIGYAAEHDAKALRILGKRILDVVAPEVGEAHEAKVLDERSATPRRRRRSGCTRTATASGTAGSPSRGCTARC